MNEPLVKRAHAAKHPNPFETHLDGLFGAQRFHLATLQFLQREDGFELSKKTPDFPEKGLGFRIGIVESPLEITFCVVVGTTDRNYCLGIMVLPRHVACLGPTPRCLRQETKCLAH